MEDNPKDVPPVTHSPVGKGIQGKDLENPKDDPHKEPEEPPRTKDTHEVVNNFLEHTK